MVKVGDVNAGKIGAWARENSVNNSFDEFEGASVGTDITRVADAVATDGDSCSVVISFLGSNKTYHLGVGDFFASVGMNVFKVDDIKVSVPLTHLPMPLGPTPTP